MDNIDLLNTIIKYNLYDLLLEIVDKNGNTLDKAYDLYKKHEALKTEIENFKYSLIHERKYNK